MKIKEISDRKNSQTKIFTDSSKNLNFICGKLGSDKTTLYHKIKSAILDGKDDELKIEKIEKNSHCGDLMFIDSDIIEHYPQWKKIFNEKYFMIKNRPNKDNRKHEMMEIVKQLNNILEEFYPKNGLIIELDCSDKIKYPEGLTLSKLLLLFFCELIFLRKLINYDMPLIIDGCFDLRDTSAHIAICALCYKMTIQSIIFVSDTVIDTKNDLVLDDKSGFSIPMIPERFEFAVQYLTKDGIKHV